MVSSDETISQIIKTAGYIPGLMSMSFESLDDLLKNIKECILDEWESIFDQNPGDKWQSDENLKLFVAVLHKLPILTVDLLHEEVKQLLKIKCFFLMYINEDQIPMLYVDLPPSTVSSMIRSISCKCLSRIQSDEPSVVGCCLEGTVTAVLQNLTTIMKLVYQISSLRYVPQNDEKFVLNHTVPPCRYNAETIENVLKSLLYRTEIYTPAVDFFSIVEVRGIGLCLLLVQISTIKSGTRRRFSMLVYLSHSVLLVISFYFSFCTCCY